VIARNSKNSRTRTLMRDSVRYTGVGLFLLAITAAAAAAVDFSSSHRKHISPAKLYGHGGRGVLASETLNYEGVITCVLEIADRSFDARLNHIELEQALDRYVSAYEQLAGGLSAATIIAQCDSDRDGVLSQSELSVEASCLRRAQLESLTRYLCDRAKHKDYVFDQYRATYDSLRAAIAQDGIRGLVQRGMETVREVGAPHEGRYARLDSPSSKRKDLIGARLEPEFILAGLFVVFIVLVVAAISAVAPAEGV
jgi:hypothetical protein